MLKAAIERLAGDGADLPFAGEVEAYIREALRREKPDRPLDTNVEFFTAILLDALHDPAAGLYADLRGGPRRRMDRARPRAAADRPADTAKFGLYRPDAGLRAYRRHVTQPGVARALGNAI